MCRPPSWFFAFLLLVFLMPVLNATTSQNGVATNGMTANAYKASRFTADPVTDQVAPSGGADDPLGVSVSDTTFGNGWISGSVSDTEPRYLQMTGGGDGHTYWSGPWVPSSDTQQGPVTYSAPARVVANNLLSAGGSTQSYPLVNATVPFTGSATGFPSSGTVYDAAAQTAFTYSAISGSSFTGCNGGRAGALLTAGDSLYLVYRNGSYKRFVRIKFDATTNQQKDQAILNFFVVRDGQTITNLVPIGINQFAATTTVMALYLSFTTSEIVGPYDYYGAYKQLLNAGTIPNYSWEEDDLR